ncbi:MAG: thioesterase [Oscillospiraceae bacterium]|nr:thioesterase [Oscillospiraceae bacterium]
MTNNFSAETYDKKRVYFYECDYLGRLKLSEILKLSAELAGFDYTRKGFSHEYLWDRGMVFLVNKVSFRINSYPSNQQKLISSTWEEPTKGAVFPRGFRIMNEQNEVLIQGVTSWILVDPVSRKIIKPSKVNFDMPKISDRLNPALEAGKIKYSDLQYAGKRIVRISDLDSNGHVYNSVYADIACDTMNETEYKQNVVNFRINYINEAHLNDCIELYKQQDKDRLVVIGKTNERICFETEFLY